MREDVLKRFFLGEATAAELARDVAGSIKQLSSIVSRVEIEDMNDELRVTRPMLVSLCDAVLGGSLPPDALGTIGFALEASDKFAWDGGADELVARVIADWSCPEINYPLTLENVGRFRDWLTGTDTYPTPPKTVSGVRGPLISQREKKSLSAPRKRVKQR